MLRSSMAFIKIISPPHDMQRMFVCLEEHLLDRNLRQILVDYGALHALRGRWRPGSEFAEFLKEAINAACPLWSRCVLVSRLVFCCPRPPDVQKLCVPMTTRWWKACCSNHGQDFHSVVALEAIMRRTWLPYANLLSDVWVGLEDPDA
jgi:hypothetical protein